MNKDPNQPEIKTDLFPNSRHTSGNNEKTAKILEFYQNTNLGRNNRTINKLRARRGYKAAMNTIENIDPSCSLPGSYPDKPDISGPNRDKNRKFSGKLSERIKAHKKALLIMAGVIITLTAGVFTLMSCSTPQEPTSGYEVIVNNNENNSTSITTKNNNDSLNTSKSEKSTFPYIVEDPDTEALSPDPYLLLELYKKNLREACKNQGEDPGKIKEIHSVNYPIAVKDGEKYAVENDPINRTETNGYVIQKGNRITITTDKNGKETTSSFPIYHGKVIPMNDESFEYNTILAETFANTYDCYSTAEDAILKFPDIYYKANRGVKAAEYMEDSNKETTETFGHYKEPEEQEAEYIQE